MNPLYKLYNTLIHRELPPPPISVCNIGSIPKFRNFVNPLLHQAHASCGRVLFMCMLLGLLPLGFGGCEKPMEYYVWHESSFSYYPLAFRLKYYRLWFLVYDHLRRRRQMTRRESPMDPEEVGPVLDLLDKMIK